jgi:hypothetical protein
MEAFELRLWDGRLGRWLTVDPYHEFHSPYVGMGNNPVNLTDPDGGCTKCPKNNVKPGDQFNHPEAGMLTYKEFENGGSWLDSAGGIYMDDVVIGANTMTPFDVGVEWLTGNGPRHRDFFAGDTFTEMIKSHDHVRLTEDIIARKMASGEKLSDHHYYSLGGIQGVGKYLKDYSTLLTFGKTGNLAVTYLGSYDLKFTLTNVDVKNRTVMVNFRVENSSTLQSATRPPVIGYTDPWKKGPGKWINTIIPKTGPMSETTQTIQWSQAVKF